MVRGCYAALALFCCLGMTTSARPAEWFQPLDPPRVVQIMAHRGTVRHAPENTGAALEATIADTIEWAEIDLRLTRDGQHVVFHDAHLDTKTDGQGAVSEQTWSALAQLDAGKPFAVRFAGTRLLDLPTALRLAHGRLNLYLDIKSADPRRLVEEIRAADMLRQVLVFADAKFLTQLRAANGEAIPRLVKWHGSEPIETFVERLRPTAVEIDAPELAPDVVRTFHEQGVLVEAKLLGEWDQAAWYARAREAGVDFVQTDYPERWLGQWLRANIEHWPAQVALHRGANRYAPENTWPAVEQAILCGADFVEIDLHTSADGEHPVLHDRSVDRTTDGHGPVARQIGAQLRALDAGSWFGRPYAGTRIPLFEELVVQALKVERPGPPVGLYLDAKAIAAEQLARVMREHNLVERSVVYQAPGYLERVREQLPAARLLAPLVDPRSVEKLAARLRPYAVDARWQDLSPELIARCHALQIRVFSDAVGDHDQAADHLQAMAWGIDLIQTDAPMQFFRALELWQHAHRPAGRE